MPDKTTLFFLKKIMMLILMMISYARAEHANASPLPSPWIHYNQYEYDAGVTSSDAFEGNFSAYMKSKEHKDIGYVGKISQIVTIPYNWQGNKIRLIAYVRTVNVKNAAGLYMRADTDYGENISDYMRRNRIKGNTGWNKYEIILDIPEDTSEISFGVWLMGEGEVRADKFVFERILSDTKVPGKKDGREYGMPVNLDFESFLDPNRTAGRYPLAIPWNQTNLSYGYETGIITSEPFDGLASAYLRSVNLPINFDYVFMGQRFLIPECWLGKRIRLSVYAETLSVRRGAGLFMEVLLPYGKLADYMKKRHISGDTGWRCYRIVSDIPDEATWIKLGAWLYGKGEIRTDNFGFEETADEKVTTRFIGNEKYRMPRNLDFEQTK